MGIPGKASGSPWPVNPSPTTTVSPAAGAAQRVAPLWFGLRPGEWAALLAVSAFPLAASHLSLWPIAVTEAWGFVTGGVCVWLVVRAHL